MRQDDRTPEEKIKSLQSEIEDVKQRAEARQDTLVQHLMGILNMYLAVGDNTISMLVGPATRAEVKFHGPISQEVISDLMAHLGFYRKYFPKKDGDPDCLTAEKLVTQFREVLAEDRTQRIN